MLVTACKHCGARFRVTPEQLNQRQGQVRCGQCDRLFNGFESLERFPGDNTGTRVLAARAGAKAAMEPKAADAEARFDTRLGKAPSGPKRPPGSPTVEDLADVPDLVEGPPDSGGIPSPRHSGAGILASPPTAAGPYLLPAPEPYLETPPPRPSRAWGLGVALLLLLLALQLAYAFRAQLARQYPDLRPVLESACATAGCTVPWVNEEAALRLEDSELLEVPGKPGQIALQARIRNLSVSPQQFPHLELTLTDVTGQTAVRRVLRPSDYLGRAAAPGEVMPAGSEALLSVRLETNRIRPTGYELLLFYP